MEEKNAQQDVEMIQVQSFDCEIRQLYYQVTGYMNIKMLNKQVEMDGLTEIPNRRTVDIVIEQWMKEEVSISLMMLDIDYLRNVNDDLFEK